MTNIIRIPANAQALLSLVHDGINDKHDVVELEYNYGYVEEVTFPAAWGYWKLDETTGTRIDATGNGHDGAVTGSLSYEAGKLGNAMVYEGSAEYITASGVPDFRSDAKFTLTFWMKIHWLGAFGNVSFIPVDISGSSYLEFGFNVYSDDGKIDDMFSDTDSRYAYYEPGTAINADEWHFYCVYYDGTGLYIEVDNVAGGNDAGVSGIDNAFTALKIGVSESSIGNVQVAIDEVGLWPVALTAGQRSQLFNSGAGWSPY